MKGDGHTTSSHHIGLGPAPPGRKIDHNWSHLPPNPHRKPTCPPYCPTSTTSFGTTRGLGRAVRVHPPRPRDPPFLPPHPPVTLGPLVWGALSSLLLLPPAGGSLSPHFGITDEVSGRPQRGTNEDPSPTGNMVFVLELYTTSSFSASWSKGS